MAVKVRVDLAADLLAEHLGDPLEDGPIGLARIFLFDLSWEKVGISLIAADEALYSYRVEVGTQKLTLLFAKKQRQVIVLNSPVCCGRLLR